MNMSVGGNKNDRRPNLNSQFLGAAEKRLGLSFSADAKGDLKKTFGPEDIFAYIYAVLYSPAYRARYVEFLKIDFPRVPLVSDGSLFRDLVEKGSNLIAVHIMDSERLENLITTFPEK
jgi:predicted helicase